MFDDHTRPVLRGDLFTLLDPEPGEDQVTPAQISRAARHLAARVDRGERAPGSPLVMRLLNEIAGLSAASPDSTRAFAALGEIRAYLKRRVAGERPDELPWPKIRERLVVLPQKRSASLVRVLPVGESYFVMTREAKAAEGPVEADLELETERAGSTDAALGPALVPPVDVTFRLFRFGGEPSDIRLVMRVVQEAGTYREVLCAGDGERLVALSRDVIGVFDETGKAVLSGRVPLDNDVAAGAEVTSLALEGDILALNIRSAAGRLVELALLNVAERRGLPIGTVGEDAGALALGDKQAYVIDGLNLVRVPLFQPGAEVSVFRLRPWFAEHPWRPRTLLAWDAGRVWVSNGDKLVVLSGDLSEVLSEIILPTPVVDFGVNGSELWLVTFDPNLSVARIRSYDLR